MSEAQQITYFAETDFRNKKLKFGIKASDRTRHMYVIGKTGMGKSTMLENMAVQDILNGNGLAVMDPHGSFAERILEYVPPERVNDVIYFAPFDMEYPVSFNVMEDVGYDKRHLVVSGLMSAFEKIWADAWSARMAYILQNTLFALLEYPDSTLLDINKMLVNKAFRKDVVDKVTDPTVKSFWTDEFAKYTERYTQEATPAIQNKIGQFTSNPVIRNIVGQPQSTFDIRKIMDEKKILIMNLSKGRIGEGNTNLLGSMLITKIYLAAMSRADAPNMATLPNFYFFVDEFQSFANKSFADILSEARKYKLNLTIAHQYVEQMDEDVRSAVFGNVGSMIVFRVGSFDADLFEKEFAPQFVAEDIVNLGFAQIYLRLMIDGVGSKPFSGTTLPPIAMPAISMKQTVIDTSRKNYAKARVDIEENVRTRQALFSEEASSGGAAKGSQGGYDRRPTGGVGGGYAHSGGGAVSDRRTAPSFAPNTEKRDMPFVPPAPPVSGAPGASFVDSRPTPPSPAQGSRPAQPAPMGVRRQFLGPASKREGSGASRPVQHTSRPPAPPIPAPVSVPKATERPVSLSSLKREIAQTAQVSDNRGALREALKGALAAVDAQEKDGEAKRAITSKDLFPKKPVDDEDDWKTIHGEPEVAKSPEPKVPRVEEQKKKPQEIPENVLRKVLNDVV
ncbi:MAG: type IV secretion system DNA-binding domain-containing protein [Candidatus Yonathbacteria bacterium]|nr:type IV secretion system DNA-binding domain-containing protein [Candidatus Yonathbacteria bacterium]